MTNQISCDKNTYNIVNEDTQKENDIQNNVSSLNRENFNVQNHCFEPRVDPQRCRVYANEILGFCLINEVRILLFRYGQI